VRKADKLPPSCAVVTKSGSLNFLEPSGPVQACNGTALYMLCAQKFQIGNPTFRFPVKAFPNTAVSVATSHYSTYIFREVYN